jgi:hypothetical protein
MSPAKDRFSIHVSPILIVFGGFLPKLKNFSIEHLPVFFFFLLLRCGQHHGPAVLPQKRLVIHSKETGYI